MSNWRAAWRSVVAVSVLMAICGAARLACGQECDGLVSVVPATEGYAVAVCIETDGSIQGIRWYNNDDQVAFPLVELVVAGSRQEYAPGGVLYAEEDVFGPAERWATLSIPEEQQSATGLCYVVFHLPERAGDLWQGTGGGAGVGSRSGASAEAGFILHDGAVVAGLRGEVMVSAVSETAGKALATRGVAVAGMGQNANVRALPNPLRSGSDIHFALPAAGRFRLDVFDLRGRLVRSLGSGVLPAGGHARAWLGDDSDGRRVSTGVYLLRLTTDTGVTTSRVSVVR